jgi:hypothetical protein
MIKVRAAANLFITEKLYLAGIRCAELYDDSRIAINLERVLANYKPASDQLSC